MIFKKQVFYIPKGESVVNSTCKAPIILATFSDNSFMYLINDGYGFQPECLTEEKIMDMFYFDKFEILKSLISFGIVSIKVLNDKVKEQVQLDISQKMKKITE